MQTPACMAAADLPGGVYLPPDERGGPEEAAMLQGKHARPSATPQAATGLICIGALRCGTKKFTLLNVQAYLVAKCGFQGIHDLQCMAELSIHSQQLQAVQPCDCSAARGRRPGCAGRTLLLGGCAAGGWQH